MEEYIDEEIAEILGICLGDGCISITNRYKEFAISGDRVEEKSYYDNRIVPLLNKKLFLPLLNKEISAKEYKKTGVYGVINFNKRVVEQLLAWGLKPSPKLNHGVPEQIKIGNKKIKRAFLRGFFDTDGSIYFGKNYSAKNPKNNVPYISIAGVSKQLIYDCVEMCEELGFKVRIKNPRKGKRDKNTIYSFVIYLKKDIQRWLEEIGFASLKHNTKIELWKKTGECPAFTTIEQRLKVLNNVSPIGQT